MSIKDLETEAMVLLSHRIGNRMDLLPEIMRLNKKLEKLREVYEELMKDRDKTRKALEKLLNEIDPEILKMIDTLNQIRGEEK